jgi:peptidoglycan hydrolase CwlO-like protein
MLDINIEQTVQGLGMIALAIIVVFVGIQKVLKDWRSTNAETNIITLMHTELERMSEQNTSLSTELGRLHVEVITLSTELQKLTVENQRLQAEVVALTNEISEFKALTRKENYGKIKIN